VHLFFGIMIAFFSLAIIRDRNIFSSCPISIEALSDTFLAFRLIFAKAVDKFLAVFSASARSLIWRNICRSNFWYWELLQSESL
jgi:hypothetical protein